jgi:hypothetical protein
MAYGLRIINNNNELLIDSNFVNPTFIRKLEFNTTPSAADELQQLNLHDGYTRRFYSTPTITMGVGNYIVLWTLPDSIVPDQPEKEVWYLFPTSVAEITSTSPVLNNLSFDCEVFASTLAGTNSTTYSLPTAYIFAVDIAGLSSLTSTGPALRMYNSATPQKKTFDSNFMQLVPYDISNNFALPTDTSPPNTPNSPTGTSLYLSTPTNPIYLLPKTAVAFASQRTVVDEYSSSTNYTDWAVFDVVFKRVGQYIESRTMRTANDSEQMSFTPLFATYFAGTYTNLSIIVADADLYQASGAGTGGGAIPTYSLSSNVSSVNEGGSFTIALTTTNIANGTAIAYTVTGIEALDLTAGALTGNFTVNNNTATATFTVRNDNLTEGTQTFRLQVNTGSYPYIDITILDTSTAVVTSYAITPAANNVNEDFNSLSITVSGTNTTAGTHYWSINHVTTTAADFYANSGYFTMANDSGSFSITPQVDNITEGAQTFTVSVRLGSPSGVLLVTSSTITINDTSLWPTAGTLLSASCLYDYGVSPYTLRQVIANGSGGSGNFDTSNSTTCGYIAPGTLQSSSCLSYGVAPYTLRNTYYNGPDATYGTYNVDTNNSATCGWTQTYNETISASPSIVSLNSYTDLEIFDGSPNATAYIVSTNNGDAQPALGTFTSSTPFYLDSSGYYINTVLGSAISTTAADKRLWVYFPYSGNYRSARVQVVLNAGTAVGGEYCSGTTLYQNYANGSGGTYAQVVEYYSTSCGWTPPTATWTVSYTNSNSTGNINVTVNVTLSGPSPTAQTFYFSGYVLQNSAGFDLPSVTVNAGASSGSGFGWSGFVNGTSPYSLITLVASVEISPYTISPSSRNTTFFFSSSGGGIEA